MLTLSGIDAIFIDGERYDDLTNGTLDVRLRDLDDDYKADFRSGRG